MLLSLGRISPEKRQRLHSHQMGINDASLPEAAFAYPPTANSPSSPLTKILSSELLSDSITIQLPSIMNISIGSSCSFSLSQEETTNNPERTTIEISKKCHWFFMSIVSENYKSSVYDMDTHNMAYYKGRRYRHPNRNSSKKLKRKNMNSHG